MRRWRSLRAKKLGTQPQQFAMAANAGAKSVEQPAERARMRVLIVVADKPLAGGIESYYRNLAPHFTFDAEYFPVGRSREDLGPITEAGRLVGMVLRFVSRLIRARPNVVLLNPSLATRPLIRELTFLILAKCAGRRCIVFFHGWAPELASKIEHRHRRALRRVLNLADALVVLAEQFKRSLHGWGVTRPVYVESTATELPEDPDALFAMRRDRASGPLQLLFLARLIKSKGLNEAIETVRILRQRGLDVELTVAGDGPELEPAKKRVCELGIEPIRFLGYVRGSEKHDALAKADLFFLPTRHDEGMSIAVLEAMAYGLPVVSRAVGGVVDFFRCPQMGAITDSTDPAEFATLIEGFIERRRRLEAGRFNMEFAARFFAVPLVAGRLERLIFEVANSSAGHDGSSRMEPRGGPCDRDVDRLRWHAERAERRYGLSLRAPGG
jgi:glycosyltransferase involved in cell wall biosynthesis